MNEELSNKIAYEYRMLVLKRCWSCANFKHEQLLICQEQLHHICKKSPVGEVMIGCCLVTAKLVPFDARGWAVGAGQETNKDLFMLARVGIGKHGAAIVTTPTKRIFGNPTRSAIRVSTKKIPSFRARTDPSVTT